MTPEIQTLLIDSAVILWALFFPVFLLLGLFLTIQVWSFVQKSALTLIAIMRPKKLQGEFYLDSEGR